MFHIIFSADENYIKYTAVLMTSIVLNTNKNYTENEKYVFHILSDCISNETRQKLLKFQTKLNQTFPCEIKLHIMKNEDFEDFPISGAAHSSKLSYYRLKFISLLDESVKKCLYLDSDMLCLCDIRELFLLNLKDKIVAVVGDPGSKKAKIKYKENNKKRTFHFDENYFNAGFLFINVKEYKKQDIELKCKELASKCFYIKSADQDLLNAIIKPEYRLKLDFSYNFNIITLLYAICKDEKKNRLNYTRKEFIQSAKNMKILHYGEKPWRFLKSYTDLKGKNINDYWWDMASLTPVFKEELLELKKEIKDYLLYAGLGFKLYNLCQKYNLLSISSLLKNEEKDQIYMQKAKELNDEKFGLYCMLGEIILYARRHKKGVFNIILKAYKMINLYKKYAHRLRNN